MSTLHDWLNGTRDFAKGVALFAEHGGGAFYQTMFDKAGPTDYNKSKLLAEITRMAGTAPIAPKAEKPPKKEQVKPSPSPNPTPDRSNDNRRYLDLMRKKNTLYTHLDFLMSEKRHLPVGAKLRECAFDIIRTHQQIVETWALIDHYQEHQKFPDAKPVVHRDDDTRIQYLRQSISKAKARLLKPNCRNKAATERLIIEKQAELDQLINTPAP